MSTRPPARKPAAFSLDDARISLAAEAESAPRTGVVVMPEPEPSPALPAASPTPAKRRFLSWGALFWSAAAALVLLALALAVVKLVEDLFARAGWLGWLGLALALLATIALVVVVIREARGMLRLAAVEELDARAEAVIASDDRAEGRALVRELLTMTHHIPQLARARANLATHLSEIIDGRDLLRLSEHDLMAPLDLEARRIIGNAATRVSAVTALSPRALFDILFVGVTAFALVRKLAALYGGRPGTLGMLRIGRMVVSHLAFTGGMAAGESLLQQLVGHGLAARLSAKLGEGVLNGILTARVGLATIEVVRPLPFVALRKPSLNDLAGSLLRGDKPGDDAGAPDRRSTP